MDKNNNPQQPRNKKNTFSTIFLPLLLVVGMCLTINRFIFKKYRELYTSRFGFRQ